MKNITASDRSALIRLAASLPVGDENRRAILAGLVEVKTAALTFPWGVQMLTPGRAYHTVVGVSPGAPNSGGHRTSVFLGYKASGNTVAMRWRDVPQDKEVLLKGGGVTIGQLRGALLTRDTNEFSLPEAEWEAYIYRGLFFVQDSSVGATGFLWVY